MYNGKCFECAEGYTFDNIDETTWAAADCKLPENCEEVGRGFC
jgi:hypothetical protein